MRGFSTRVQSGLTQLRMEKRAGKMVPVQKEVDAKDLVAKQPIAVIDTDAKEGHILLSAVVQPAREKSMDDSDRLKLLHGPYKPPRCRIGQKLFCELRGWVT